jgi:hypothetical protein
MRNLTKKMIWAGVLIACSATTLISCSTDETPKSSSVKETAVGNAADRIRIKFTIGLSANLEKPSRGCDSGWGVCSVTIGLVNVGFERINFGVSSDNYLYFAFDHDQVEGEVVSIEAGDEYIRIDDEIVREYANDDFDISNIQLVRGDYPVVYDSSSDKYVVRIPFVKNKI